MTGKKNPVAKKPRAKRPVGLILESMKHVFSISHVPEKEAIWQWGEAKEGELPSIFDIGIWNIWKGLGGDEFLTEYQRMVKDRHLLLFQEALLTLKLLAQYAPDGYAAHHGATYRRKDGYRDGVMTVCAVAPDQGGKRVLCLAPEPLLRTTKATLITKFKVKGKLNSLCVVNTHATLMRRPSTATRELEQVIKHIVTHPGAIIYAGDFNTFSPSYIAEADRALASIGLKRVVIEGDPRTSTTALDQLYVRGVEVIEAKIDTSYLQSDHFPITAKIRIE